MTFYRTSQYLTLEDLADDSLDGILDYTNRINNASTRRRVFLP